MIQMAGETFVDEVQASAHINTLLELKFALPRKSFKDLPLSRRAELYKAAKKRWLKSHKAP